MVSEKPSAWAKQEANRLFGWRGPLTHDEMVRLATALDAARNEGRREREGEIVGWLRDTGAEMSHGEREAAADAIERGEHLEAPSHE